LKRAPIRTTPSIGLTWRMPYQITHENTMTTDTGLLSDAKKRRGSLPTAIDATPIVIQECGP
jgi:hypothetical protein